MSEQPPLIDRLYNEKEAARIFGVAPRTIREWRRKKLIEFVRTPTGRIRFSAEQILAGRMVSR